MTTLPLFESEAMPEAVAYEHAERSEGGRASKPIPAVSDERVRREQKMPQKHRITLEALRHRGPGVVITPLDIEAYLRLFGVFDTNVSRTVSEMREYMNYARTENTWGWTERVSLGRNTDTGNVCYGWILHEGGK